jgi:hypothetical protein
VRQRNGFIETIVDIDMLLDFEWKTRDDRRGDGLVLGTRGRARPAASNVHVV